MKTHSLTIIEHHKNSISFNLYLPVPTKTSIILFTINIYSLNRIKSNRSVTLNL